MQAGPSRRRRCASPNIRPNVNSSNTVLTLPTPAQALPQALSYLGPPREKNTRQRPYQRPACPCYCIDDKTLVIETYPRTRSLPRYRGFPTRLALSRPSPSPGRHISALRFGLIQALSRARSSDHPTSIDPLIQDIQFLEQLTPSQARVRSLVFHSQWNPTRMRPSAPSRPSVLS